MIFRVYGKIARLEREPGAIGDSEGRLFGVKGH